MKLKAAETLIETERLDFQTKITKVVEEYKAKLQANSCQNPRASHAINQISKTEPIDENSLLQDKVDILRKMVADLV